MYRTVKWKSVELLLFYYYSYFQKYFPSRCTRLNNQPDLLVYSPLALWLAVRQQRHRCVLLMHKRRPAETEIVTETLGMIRLVVDGWITILLLTEGWRGTG